VLDFYGHTEGAVLAHARERLACLAHAQSLVDSVLTQPDVVATDEVKDEIVELVKSGPPGNRIDLVFMVHCRRACVQWRFVHTHLSRAQGDGYTEGERERFIGDMKRLVKDMFASTTFASHLPLFNIWAVFRPSVDSGVGVGGKPKVCVHES
jgi:hypothetical protein